MPASRKHRKQARWAAETYRREAPLDEVPNPTVKGIAIPTEDMPASHRAVDADAAALALRMQVLRRQIRIARWIPWRRRNRPLLRTELEELSRQRRALRSRGSATQRL